MYDDKFLRDIMKDIEECFLIDGKGFIILDGYEYMRDITTLYAKQHNLLESTLLLLENNNAEEAVILARSLLNNYFLIGYLLKDNKNRTRLKRFHNQPLITRMKKLRNIKEIISNSTSKLLSDEDKEKKLKELKKKIVECEKMLKENGIKRGERLLDVCTLAKNSDEKGFALYTFFYSDASKFEHSDISSLDLYKKQVLEEYSNNEIFILNINSTDEELKDKIFEKVETIYCDTFSKIISHIFENESHLLKNFNQEKLNEICIKITNKFSGKLNN
ncbi:hypothetical protein CP118TE_12840 [Clostridium perfringens E]|uniref:DUF5677 domain-containing protein n=1 Tax=Clostridium perfringens TaxID=1502 RepID=UPI00220FD6E8|nr:DUF5677 domain-containing protein [Clostridium perfringens]ELQ0171760.1 hypothetical protein [Clostridium perfringens]BDC01575.1 hypothetical protein CP118TE_12840 [Clostridium perfringens E]